MSIMHTSRLTASSSAPDRYSRRPGKVCSLISFLDSYDDLGGGDFFR